MKKEEQLIMCSRDEVSKSDINLNDFFSAPRGAANVRAAGDVFHAIFVANHKNIKPILDKVTRKYVYRIGIKTKRGNVVIDLSHILTNEESYLLDILLRNALIGFSETKMTAAIFAKQVNLPYLTSSDKDKARRLLKNAVIGLLSLKMALASPILTRRKYELSNLNPITLKTIRSNNIFEGDQTNSISDLTLNSREYLIVLNGALARCFSDGKFPGYLLPVNENDKYPRNTLEEHTEKVKRIICRLYEVKNRPNELTMQIRYICKELYGQLPSYEKAKSDRRSYYNQSSRQLLTILEKLTPNFPHRYELRGKILDNDELIKIAKTPDFENVTLRVQVLGIPEKISKKG